MLLHEWTTLAAATGQASLGVLAALRGGKSPLAVPLALLCFCIFGWNIADLVSTVHEDMSWKLIDHALSPFTAPLTLHFVLVFTGLRRRLSPWLIASYVPLGLLSLSSLLGFVWPPAREFQEADAWSFVHLGLVIPIIALAVGCLIVYRREADREEWRRARLILVALSLGFPLAVTDLLEGVVPFPVPPLANVGTLAAAALLAVVALRFRLFGADLSTSAVTFALGSSLIVVLAYAALSGLLLASTPVLVLGTATAALIVGLLLRMALEAGAARRAREAQLVTLGRFAAQTAHDLKNPLAAMKGAVQFLIEERRRGATLDASALPRSLAGAGRTDGAFARRVPAAGLRRSGPGAPRPERSRARNARLAGIGGGASPSVSSSIPSCRRWTVTATSWRALSRTWCATRSRPWPAAGPSP